MTLGTKAVDMAHEEARLYKHFTDLVYNVLGCYLMPVDSTLLHHHLQESRSPSPLPLMQVTAQAQVHQASTLDHRFQPQPPHRRPLPKTPPESPRHSWSPSHLSCSVISKYRMQSQPLGVCLIIDCIGNDAGMLADTFKALHFEVRCHLFLNVGSMMRELNDVARLREHKGYDCFVCILVSRGDHQGIFCTDHVVPGFSLERVKHYFVGDRCPDLLGKPKLFFIQNYVEARNWEHNTSLVEADGDLNLPLLDILVELNNRVYERNRTNPAEQYSLVLKHTLRKKLFFS
ncbi:hypothetical protein JD844_023169 [Phrynosoma platyrhinos]|uniref:Caspase family p20 domain-containing protein n=1 Tax=Phrynosoma platyrhinos TaxID=52577 RepID=A0ABQ7SW30_PHRPL|nr:hypothetical protein JD844_023169 [Phrynosoma platyrhinos]